MTESTGVLMKVGLGIVAAVYIFLFTASATAQTTAGIETPTISLSVPSGAPLRLLFDQADIETDRGSGGGKTTGTGLCVRPGDPCRDGRTRSGKPGSAGRQVAAGESDCKRRFHTASQRSSSIHYPGLAGRAYGFYAYRGDGGVEFPLH
jgi:hypothetical protein